MMQTKSISLFNYRSCCLLQHAWLALRYTYLIHSSLMPVLIEILVTNSPSPCAFIIAQ